MSSPTRLFQSTTSSASWRARIALALKGVQYEPVWIDLDAGEHLRGSYARVVATQQVPCLEIDGVRLVQTVAMLEYLEETRPDPPLLPCDPVARAEVRTVVETINSAVQPMHNLAVRLRLAEQFKASPEATQAWCVYWIERRLSAVERLVEQSGGIYCVGDRVTLADVFLFPLKTVARFGVDVAQFELLSEVVTRLSGLEAFEKSELET